MEVGNLHPINSNNSLPLMAYFIESHAHILHNKMVWPKESIDTLLKLVLPCLLNPNFLQPIGWMHLILLFTLLIGCPLLFFTTSLHTSNSFKGIQIIPFFEPLAALAILCFDLTINTSSCLGPRDASSLDTAQIIKDIGALIQQQKGSI